MNRRFAVISVLAGWVLGSPLPCAQGSMTVSNLDLPSVGSLAVAADSWLAAQFSTGDNPLGYVLNSVSFSMVPASGSASGFAASLYTDSDADPGSFLGSLNGPDPSAGGLFAYTAGGIRLEPESSYYLVMTAENLVVGGFYGWNQANSPDGYDAVDGWTIWSGYHSSGDGTDWNFVRSFPLQFGVDAMVVPEPATIWLVVLGFGSLVGGRALRIGRGG